MIRPWMPLYVGDYIADTEHLTAAESGAYLHLIMYYWVKGGLPNEDRLLARIARMTPEEWIRAKSLIQEFFQDGWKHKRIEFELTEAARISAAGRAGGIASGEARRSKPSPIERNRTIVERPLNDPPNDSPTNCEALQSQSPTFVVKNPPSSDSSLGVSRNSEPRAKCNARASDWPDNAWDEFYSNYPHKVGKKAARRAFERVRGSSTGPPWAEFMAGLTRYIAKDDDRAWCNPATWINEGRWDDQPAPQPKQERQNGTGSSVNAVLDRLTSVDDCPSDQGTFLRLPER